MARKKTTENKQYRDEDWPKGLYRRSNGRYFWRRMVNGSRVSKDLNTGNHAVAVKAAAGLNADVDDFGVPAEQAVLRDEVTFDQMAEDYLEHRNLRPSTKKRYGAMRVHFQRVAESIIGRRKILVSDVTTDLLTKYVSRRLKEPTARNGHPNTPKNRGTAKPKTVRSELGFIRSVLGHAVENGIIPAVPPARGATAPLGKRRNQESVARPLDEHEIPRMLQAARAYDRNLEGKFPYRTYFHDIISTYIYAGLRHEELRFLEWDDVDFNNGLICVRSKHVLCTRKIPLTEETWNEVKDLFRNRNSKGSAFPEDDEVLDRAGYLLAFRDKTALLRLQRKDFCPEEGIINYREEFYWGPKASQGEVVLHPRLKEILEALKGQSESNFVFPDSDGGYWRMRFERHMKAIAKEAKIPNFTRVHDLRHTTGAMLRRKGVALETIKEILRHANIEETLIYAKYEHAEGQEAIRKLPDW